VEENDEQAGTRRRKADSTAEGIQFGAPARAGLKRKDFVASVRLTEEQVCGLTFMKEFTTACRKTAPLVEFTTKALGLKL
jgi:hypothetical protein